ncbi:hypothetical protein [Cytophaga sp. FL35]|uniref:hypothetical protein n=1 Tax=Cytophaga sp. FL35 TaxID=1904456 RepID=UPI000C55C921|nr:hypothetical protein [Cytophaga sp. FL35]MAU70529.1 hypothetical protein [Pseudozobellia sp.]MBC7000821.1 hypothetical protein [Cytophaga sp. FL35]MBG48017.1 hypothetical protein [Pseudozobellia sp.]|tara:strand:- start:349 stop:882 length:534 start_codon:yes stop_codon:yes gene_type:complete
MYISTSTKKAIWGGVFAILFLLSGTFLLGKLSGYEAKVLIKNSLSGLNVLCNTIVLASASILALLLTLLGLSSTSNSKLKKDHYLHVMQIAQLDTVIFIVSLLSFLIFNLPITESDSIPPEWFTIIYYITLGVSAILSGALIVVVLMLKNTVVNIIKIVGLGMQDHPLAMNDDEKDS